MSLIECCLSNVSADARRALADSDHRVRETICLDRCGTCYTDAFFIVDGELTRGGSHEDLLKCIDLDGEVCDS